MKRLHEKEKPGNSDTHLGSNVEIFLGLPPKERSIYDAKGTQFEVLARRDVLSSLIFLKTNSTTFILRFSYTSLFRKLMKRILFSHSYLFAFVYRSAVKF